MEPLRPSSRTSIAGAISPDYQLERRADVFFSLPPRAVQRLTASEIAEPVIPELPLRRGTLWGEDRSDRNLSVKVDYPPSPSTAGASSWSS